MYFWDGTNWVESTASTPTRGARGTRWGATAVMLLAAALLIVPFGTASAGCQNRRSAIDSSGRCVRAPAAVIRATRQRPDLAPRGSAGQRCGPIA
jgi:hypothetical protein